MPTYNFELTGDFLITKTVEVNGHTPAAVLQAFSRFETDELNALQWKASALTVYDDLAVTEVDSGECTSFDLDDDQLRFDLEGLSM